MKNTLNVKILILLAIMIFFIKSKFIFKTERSINIKKDPTKLAFKIPNKHGNSNIKTHATKFPFEVTNKMISNITHEILECITGSTDCTNQPIAESNLVKIPTKIYQKVIFDKSLHTNYTKTKVVTNTTNCKVGEKIGITIIPHDSNGNSKLCHGDKFLVRMVGEKDRYGWNHIIPVKIEHFYNEEGQVQYDGAIECLKPGEFTIQVYFFRTSENQELIRRLTNGVHIHELKYDCGMVDPIPPSPVIQNSTDWTSNGKMINANCGPGLNFISAHLGRHLCAYDKRPGKEWYVSMDYNRASDSIKKSRYNPLVNRVTGQSWIEEIDIRTGNQSHKYLVNSTDQEIQYCNKDIANVVKNIYQIKYQKVIVEWNKNHDLNQNIIFENEGYESLIFSQNITCSGRNEPTTPNTILGYHYNGTFISKIPRKIKDLALILKNKTLIMVGDSILRHKRVHLNKVHFGGKCHATENQWDFLGFINKGCKIS